MAEIRNLSGGLVSSTPDAADEERRRAKDAENKQTSIAGRGVGAIEKKGKKAPPKAADYGGDMGAFGTALRKYREDENSDSDMVARKRGLSQMSK